MLSIRDVDDIWGKASSERSKYQDRMVLYCTKIIQAEGWNKVVFFPVMIDKKGEVYWCYKSDIFGFHNRCMASIFSKMNIDFHLDLFIGYDEVFKRGHGDTIEVPSRMKTANNDPEKFGNKVSFYICYADENSDAALDFLIDLYVKSLVMIHQHPEYMKVCLEKTFQTYGGKYTDVMKKSMINDRTFTRIIESGKVHVEKNVRLYDVTNSEGVRHIMNQLFKNAKPPLMTWGSEMKKFCFTNGIVPKGFSYPN